MNVNTHRQIKITVKGRTSTLQVRNCSPASTSSQIHAHKATASSVHKSAHKGGNGLKNNPEWEKQNTHTKRKNKRKKMKIKKMNLSLSRCVQHMWQMVTGLNMPKQLNNNMLASQERYYICSAHHTHTQFKVCACAWGGMRERDKSFCLSLSISISISLSCLSHLRLHGTASWHVFFFLCFPHHAELNNNMNSHTSPVESWHSSCGCWFCQRKCYFNNEGASKWKDKQRRGDVSGH